MCVWNYRGEFRTVVGQMSMQKKANRRPRATAVAPVSATSAPELETPGRALCFREDRLGFAYVVDGVGACVALALALLLDASRGLTNRCTRGMLHFERITGWRNASEVYRLLWAWVDFKAATVRLPPGLAKNREGRVFPMTAELRQVLEAQRTYVDQIQRERGRIIPQVWCWPDGRPIKTVRGSWNKAREKAGCPARIPHDFRRTAVRDLERAGVPRSVAMRMVGHKTEAVYRRYAIVAEADLHEAARRLDGVAEKR
jgi:integrase